MSCLQLDYHEGCKREGHFEGEREGGDVTGYDIKDGEKEA
jgi:hypothetical protein